MKINKGILIIFISLIIFTISAVNAQDTTNGTADLMSDENIFEVSDNSIYVDGLEGDDRNDGNSWDSSVKSLEKALDLSSDGYTIYISSGNYNSENNTRLNITKSVNIVGSENTVFDGLGNDYLFIVKDGVSVTFKNISFVNAFKNQDSFGKHDSSGEVINNGTFYGAALEIKDSTVTIDNCNFINNVLSGTRGASGAAISNLGDLTILNSYFYGNTLNSGRGYIYSGGSIYNKGNLKINNSSFISSKSKNNARGAAIANYGILEMDNSVIANSTIGYDSEGSAIYNDGVLILRNSVIKNNAYTANGGQIHGAIKNLGNFTGYGNIFEKNSFKVSRNIVYKFSGNVYNLGNLNLTNNVFIDNQKYGNSNEFSADVYNSGEVISLDNNWWGTNENPKKAFLTNVETISSWLILSLTPNYASLNISDELAINAELKPVVGKMQINQFPLLNISFRTSNANITKELDNGKSDFTFNYTQQKGSYEIIAELTGFKQSIFVDVGKLESNIIFNVTNDMTYQDVFQINVTVVGNGSIAPTGYVVMLLGDKEYIIDLIDGNGSYEIKKLNKGDYSLQLTYVGDEEYAKSFANTSLTVKRLPVNLTIDIPNFKVDQIVRNGEIVLNTSEAQSTYNLYIDGVYVASGRLYPGVTPIKRLGFYSIGIHEVILEYEGSDNFEPVNVTTTFEISKYSTVLNVYANDTNAGEDAIITIEAIPNELRGEAELYINGVKNMVFLEDTYTNVTVSNLQPGRYDVSIVYLGDTMYYGSNDTASFRVVRQASNLTVDIIQNQNDYSGQIIVKTIPSQCTGLIGVYVNFKSYRLNLTEGIATFDVEFYSGTNYIFVYYEGDDYFEGCEWNGSVGVADKFQIIGDNATIYEYNNFNYTVFLIEDNGVPIMYKTLTISLNGIEYNISTNNRGLAYINLNLSKGIYNVTVTYNGESIVNTITVKEISFNVTAEDITYGGDEIIVANFNNDVEGYAIFYIEDILDKRVQIRDGIALVNLSQLNAGYYNVHVKYSNEFYNSTQTVNDFNVRKASLNMTYDFNQHDYDLFVQNLEKSSGNITVRIDDIQYNSPINDSKSNFNLDGISKGNHTLVIIYAGDNNYNPYNISSYLYVKELFTDIIVSCTDGIYGKDIIVKAVIDKNASGIVRFTVEGLSQDIEVQNGVATWTFSGIDAGIHSVTAKYLGDEYYIDAGNSTSFNIGKSNSTIHIYILEAFLNENIRIYANLSSNATGKVLYSMDGYYSPRFKNTVDSKSSWYISPLDTGSYTVRATFEGDNNYYESSTVFILNITQKRSILDVNLEDITIKDREIAYITLTNISGSPISGSVDLEMGSQTYKVNIEDGKSTFVLGKLPAGNYSYTVKYKGNDEYGKSIYSGSFEVRDTRLKVVIYANNLTKYYKGDKKLSILVASSKNKAIAGVEVNVIINGKSYSAVTDDDGIIALDVNLNSGSYSALISFEGDEDYFASSANASITILSTVEGIDVTKLYGSSTQYYAIFSDSNGKPLANTEVKFTIGSKSYTATTMPNGIVRLNINLKAGVYNITAINPVTSQKYTNKLIINYRLMENKDLTKYYKGTQSYKVRAYGDDGKVASGVTVKIKIKSKTYSVKTDKNGYADLAINLKPGKYIIKSTYCGFSVSNKIVVKSTIVTKNTSVKKGNVIKFKAKLLNSNGKILKSKKITFKFKGKKYVAKTNGKGIATVKIKNNLGVGKYKIYSIYGKLTRTNIISIN